MAVSEPTRALHELTGWALQRGLVLDQLTVEPPSLEDVYLRLTDPGPEARPGEHGATRAGEHGPAKKAQGRSGPEKGPRDEPGDLPGAAG